MSSQSSAPFTGKLQDSSTALCSAKVKTIICSLHPQAPIFKIHVLFCRNQVNHLRPSPASSKIQETCPLLRMSVSHLCPSPMSSESQEPCHHLRAPILKSYHLLQASSQWPHEDFFNNHAFMRALQDSRVTPTPAGLKSMACTKKILYQLPLKSELCLKILSRRPWQDTHLLCPEPCACPTKAALTSFQDPRMFYSKPPEKVRMKSIAPPLLNI